MISNSRISRIIAILLTCIFICVPGVGLSVSAEDELPAQNSSGTELVNAQGSEDSADELDVLSSESSETDTTAGEEIQSEATAGEVVLEESTEEPVTEPEEEPEEPEDRFGYRTLKNRTISNWTSIKKNGKRLNLRTLTKQTSTGYSIVQGSCTDGTYAYYLMTSPGTERGRIVKLRRSDNKLIKYSKTLDTCHGNGICYDSKRKLIVVVGRNARRQELTFISTKTLTITRQENVHYDYYSEAGKGQLNAKEQSKGLAAIAYNKRYDCYVTLQRNNHNLIVFNPDNLQAIAFIRTDFDKKYPGTFQAMDADNQYVFLVLSYYDSTQPNNLILALDWHSFRLKPIADGKTTYIEKAWNIGSENEAGVGNQNITAAIKIKSVLEAESIYHVTNSKTGKETFYLAVYRGHYYKSKYYREDYIYKLGVI